MIGRNPILRSLAVIFIILVAGRSLVSLAAPPDPKAGVSETVMPESDPGPRPLTFYGVGRGIVATDQEGALLIQGSRSVESCLSVLNYRPQDARFCINIKIDFSEKPPNIYIAIRSNPVPGTSLFIGAATEHVCQAMRDRFKAGKGAEDLGCQGAVVTLDGEWIPVERPLLPWH